MNIVAQSLLFFFGTFVGSFLGVLGSRYSEEKGFSLSIRGRSKCDSCGKKLEWYELVPIFSFIFQRRKCRGCGVKLSFQYPIVEILSGLAFVLIPLKLGQGVPSVLWLLAFLTFILIGLIDLRLKIIPDKLTVFIASLGALLIGYYKVTDEFGSVLNGVTGSFLGSYALGFWFGEKNLLINYGAGALVGLILFGLIFYLSKGKGMGFGDVKLAGAVGLLLGWPDTLLALILSFIVGGVWGSFLILRKRKGMKDAIPFGPFIIIGVTLVFFFGYYILDGYFGVFGLR